jgi:hypothetical protein
VGEMDPQWANKIADMRDPFDLMKHVNIRLNTQCGLRGMTNPAELLRGDHLVDTGNVFIFKDATGKDMLELK